MAAHHDATDQDALLSQREIARTRARDRKRTTRMVVDNAGVKRILLARRDRAAGPTTDDGRVTAGQPAGHRAGGQ